MESDENKDLKMSTHSVKVGLISASCIELCIVMLLTLYILKKWMCYNKRLKAHIENENSFESKRDIQMAFDSNKNKKKTSLLTTVEETQETPETGE